MKPSRIILIRHGQSDGNVDRITHATVPDWKIPLTEKGREQAREAGKKVFNSLGRLELAVYCSPYLRTRQTWEEMDSQSFQVDITVKEDPRLVEQSWGNLRAFEPRKWEDIEAERDHYGPFYYRFLHGESGVEVYQRFTTFLDTLYRDFEKSDFPDNALIVTHGFTLRVLLMRWLHWSVEEFHELKNPKNCQTFELQLDKINDKYYLTKPFPRKDGEESP